MLRREIFACAAASPHVVDVVMLPQGLHDQPEILRRTVQEAIDTPVQQLQRSGRAVGSTAADRSYDAVLMGYALCSNGLAGITARDCPVIIPRAHDCITLLLGSRRRYREYFDMHPGTYWYSSGWIETCVMPGKERLEQALRVYTEKYGADNAEYLLRMEADWLKNYRRATYIDWRFPGNAQQKEFTRQCATELGWDYDELQGDQGLLQRMVNGDWRDDEFLVVSPGHSSAADPANPEILITQHKQGHYGIK